MVRDIGHGRGCSSLEQRAPVAQLEDWSAEATGASSFLGTLTAAACKRLVADSTLLEVQAGKTIFRTTDPDRRLGIVVTGLVRVFLDAPDGRSITIRHAGVGALVGNTSGPGATRLLLNVGAVTDCAVLELSRDTLRALADADTRVSSAFAEELSRRLQDTYVTLAVNCFASMAERVGLQLLYRALEDKAGRRLVVKATQQDLADDVGSAREVVARTLQDMRREGLIATGKGEVTILDPERLAALVARWL